MLRSVPSSPSNLQAIRGSILDFVADPFYCRDTESVRYYADGLLVLEAGKIKDLGDYQTLQQTYAGVKTSAYPNQLIIPGFIDLHIHYPQTEMIGAYGAQLMEWLDKYTFPTEARFKDPNHARKIAAFFLDQLLKNGTTTALVLTTIFPDSVEVLFEEAAKRQMRIIAGQVLMSRNAPDYLLNPPQTAYAQTREQIQKWHGQGRALYAITPRFAITSTPEELTLAGRLKQEFPQVYVHTHMSENLKEIALTAELFPDCQDYLQVYEHFGLVGERSVFAHCIHLNDSAFERLSTAGATIAFCPTSNLFLGSGLFKLAQAKSPDFPVRVGLATDVGAGTSFSMLQTMADAYKVMQLQGQSLSACQALYLATTGAAKALAIDHLIGNFDIGKEADFTILNLQATPLMELRNPRNQLPNLAKITDQLFATIILGDDRTITATYVAGQLVYAANRPYPVIV